MKMNQSCFSEVERKNGKSFVRQLWLGTRRSEIHDVNAIRASSGHRS